MSKHEKHHPTNPFLQIQNRNLTRSGNYREILDSSKEGKLVKNSVIAKFATTATDDKTDYTEHYKLNNIISVSYKVNL